jgi:dTDP-4-amino-4,6-dideoxygalactose transaminase
MPVHLYGRVADMDAVAEFAERLSLLVIEDACQAHGGERNGRKAGTFGTAGCFSFYPSKNLGCLGDGGMMVTDDPDLADEVRALRNYGSRDKNVHEVAGTNSRLDTVQAAILGVKLGHLDRWNRQRYNAARQYDDGLRGLNGVVAPTIHDDNPMQHVFHLYVIRCAQRDALLKHLKESGVQARVYYPIPYFRQAAFAHLTAGPGTSPVAEKAAGEIVSLPMFPEITKGQIQTVIDSIRSFYETK